MKSEKAQEYLLFKERYINITHIEVAENAVALAEQDARERAVRCLCKTVCVGGKQECDSPNCTLLPDFLKHYDDEQ